MALRLILRPPEAPEPTALSVPSAFTVIFNCIRRGLPVHLVQVSEIQQGATGRPLALLTPGALRGPG